MYSSLIKIYMCVKLLPRDLNSGPYHSHLTSTYSYRATTTLRVHGGYVLISRKEMVIFL